MTITSAIVLYTVTWFVTLFIVLPFGQKSQEEAGHVEPGSPASAPSNLDLKRKFILTTAIATTVFAASYYVITRGVITLDDLPFG